MSAFGNAQIEFPVLWHGRAIAHAHLADRVEDDLRRTLAAFGVSEAPVRGEPSRNGAYIPFAVRASMRDAAMLAGLPEALARIEGVRMLL